jgi:hypothetical protein
MPTLATSNLAVSDIKNALGVDSLREIFYKGVGLTVLKTATELKTLVRMYGLGSACPGATPATKIDNLLADRKLSYFKGYQHNDNFTLSPAYGVAVTLTTLTGKPGNIPPGATTQQVGYSESIPNQTAVITIGGSWNPGLNLRINWIVGGSTVTYTNITSGAGNYNLSIPNSAIYPTTMRISITSY